MTLDEKFATLTIDSAIQYGREEVITRFEELAKEEAAKGDGRALRIIQRFEEASGYRRKRVLEEDNGN